MLPSGAGPNEGTAHSAVCRHYVRLDVVFRFGQCDKENHGWREGPPLTVPWQSFDLLAGPSPSRQNQLRTKEEYSFAPLAALS